jgi:hypothetical protein
MKAEMDMTNLDGQWLEIPGGDATRIASEIQQCIAGRADEQADDISTVVSNLWDEMIGPWAAMMTVPIPPAECDIYPHKYVIDWRMPILGPINSIVRRVINLEIRRFLEPAIRQQSALNGQLLNALQQVARENYRLRHELDTLKEQMGIPYADSSIPSRHS